MTDKLASKPQPDVVVKDGVEYEEASHDDAVIGRALKLSLGVLAVAGAVGGGVWWWLSRPEELTAPQKTEVDAPIVAAQDTGSPAVRFTDVTTSVGIDFVHQNGAEGEKLLPETMGGGSAFLDLEDDGDADLLFVNGTFWPGSPRASERPTQRLYRNDRGRFQDATQTSGLDQSFYGMGAAAADADADGDIDVFFTAVGKNHYFSQDSGRFGERDAGIAGSEQAWSTCACFFDADRDGDLDLYVGNYVKWSREIDLGVNFSLDGGKTRAYGPPTTFEGSQPYFYRNQGGGAFLDESQEAGLHVSNPATGVPAGKALGVRASDPDLDGDLDLMVANDTVANFFYLNDGAGRFHEQAMTMGLAFDREGRATGAMGIDAAWFRNDGAIAYAIGNFANEMSSFYVSQGRAGLWADEAIGTGIGAPTRKHLSFGALFLDYDLDGRVDFLQANGHLESEISHFQASQTYEQPPQLFWNAGKSARRTFIEVPAGASGDLSHPIVGRGCASADVDGDGDLDVLLTQSGARPALLRNDQALGRHWLRLVLVGRGANRAAIGARVEVFANGEKQCQDLVPFKSYLSQVEQPLTFGLGAAAAAERILITWPDGRTQELTDVAADRTHRVEQAL